MSYYSINTFIQLCKNHALYLENIEMIDIHGDQSVLIYNIKNLYIIIKKN